MEFSGKIVDVKNGDVLPFATLSVEGSNITTVSNSEGEFSLKIPKEFQDKTLTVSYIGYKNRILKISELKQENSRITLEPMIVSLPEINVISTDAENLVLSVLENRYKNYPEEELLMTAFYRETIKKNRSYVSLSEAIVDILKQPYSSFRQDQAELYKSRKQSDYKKMDTLVFKLMGGPYNSLYMDVMKNPDYLFTESILDNYEFSFDRTTYIDHQLIYIVNFKQRPFVNIPLYYGKLYIDAESLALRSAIFHLDLTDKEKSASMLIRKKPLNAKVFLTNASYRMDYIEKNGKWYYNYSRIELDFKIDWKRKLFNSNYYTVVEMAVTNWEKATEEKKLKNKLRPTVIIADEASGFSDPEFWGSYNVIEPEKPIESAIKKIQKQLEKRK
ncbi:MAG TPA: carboxypeptidase-like regulatory domain-containing protein [Paludibacteraceae bacterium]|nr:carboxypeptidase-like regulatory domain-containing protein [Paludibacteraceae bacterium]HRS24143.1 carboxypeptidase-like regulatory domain-containing protein [Paludibacteraceae bacterium]